MRILIPLLLTIVTLASVAVAQNKKDKLEIGVQSTSLTLFHPDFPGDDTQMGFGGRVTYNFNRSIAAEAEINFFPHKQLIFTADGSAIQAQFGVKIGKRFDNAGIFGKVRPGFLSVNRVGSFIPQGAQAPNPADVKVERETFFTTDFGGVLELYPSRRTVVRFDAGDTVIRHPARFGQFFFGGPIELLRPAKFKHNFQFTAGVSFRLGDFPDKDAGINTTGEGPKRFEVGAQFTSLLVKPSNPIGLSQTLSRAHAEPGFGLRFTFNLTEVIAVEAEGNYFTREQFAFFRDGGHMFQGQFGAKVGKRFERWGLFGKARPGFVGFSKVLDFPSGVQIPPSFRFVKKFRPSLDLGGVVEFYVSPRWMARFDIGDTIIRYGETTFTGVPFSFPRVTRHNLQVSSGIGFRF
jgi:hypothetical protein